VGSTAAGSLGIPAREVVYGQCWSYRFGSTIIGSGLDIIVKSDDGSGMRYPGGKNRCFQKIINLLPPHSTYIESHLGSGAVLRNKAPAKLSIGIDANAEILSAFSDFPENYRFIHQRAEEFLTSFAFSGEEVLYCDPPYFPATRRQARVYAADYTVEDHVQLLSILTKLPCRIVLSGYDNSLYSRVLADWQRIDFEGTSHVGTRKESLWLNFTPGEVHDTTHLGWNFRERQSIKRKRHRWVARFLKEPQAVRQALLADLSAAHAQGLAQCSKHVISHR